MITAFGARLARLPVDWSRVDLFWCDERGVPPDHPDSNYGLAQRLGLEQLAARPERVHRMPGELADLAAGAAAYEAELVRALGQPPRLDVVLLGVGEDGHVASLFPGHPLLAEQRRWVASLEDAPKPPAQRLTLTLPALAAARLVVVAAIGAAKEPVLRATLAGDGGGLPLMLLARAAPRTLFLLDEQAGAGLGAGVPG